jgi:hypothetical protein
MNLNIKNKIKISLISLIFVICFFSNFFYAQTNYDIINLEANNYNYEPAPVQAGDTFELWIQLTNNSNETAEDIEYNLDLEYPFSFAEFENDNKIISKLAPYQTKIIKYNLKTETETNPGTYTIDFKYKRKGVEVYNIKKYNIDIVSQETIVDIVDSNIEDAYIGKDTKVELEIKNLGNKTAKNIFVTLDDSEDNNIKVLKLKTKFINKLEKEDSTKIEYYILANKDVDTKSYTLPITIEYSDNNKSYQINRKIGIQIMDNPKILINLLNLSENKILKTNTKQKLDIEIFNIGNVDAESVYVQIDSKITDNKTKYFIGNIEKDNYDNVDIEYEIGDIESGDYNLNIILNYKDSDLKENKIVKTYKVTVLENKASGLSFLGIINSLFSVVGLIIGLALLILILKWLYKILIKPAFKDVLGIFKKKKK